MAKKKLELKFDDGTIILYDIPSKVPYESYFTRHLGPHLKSALLKIYPLKDNEPVWLHGGEEVNK